MAIEFAVRKDRRDAVCNDAHAEWEETSGAMAAFDSIVRGIIAVGKAVRARKEQENTKCPVREP